MDQRGARNEPRVAAVVLAGGSGTRMSAAARAGRPRSNKVYRPIGGRPLLAWSLETLDAHPQVVSIVVAVRAGDEATFREAVRPLGAATIHSVIGGATRSASEQAALELLRPTVEEGGLDLVLIHDGARPFVTGALLDRLIAAADRHGAAIPGLAPERDVYEVDAATGTAHRLDTTTVRRVQTPQVFAADPLLQAYAEASRSGFDGVDTAEVVARYGAVDAVVVDGEPDNLKVTTPADLETAESIAATRTR